MINVLKTSKNTYVIIRDKKYISFDITRPYFGDRTKFQSKFTFKIADQLGVLPLDDYKIKESEDKRKVIKWFF